MHGSTETGFETEDDDPLQSNSDNPEEEQNEKCEAECCDNFGESALS
jgi:hypothetical protein